MDEVHKLFHEGITEQELSRTEERVFSQMQLVMDSPLAMANWFGIEELLITPETPDTPEKQAQKFTILNWMTCTTLFPKFLYPKSVILS